MKLTYLLLHAAMLFSISGVTCSCVEDNTELPPENEVEIDGYLIDKFTVSTATETFVGSIDPENLTLTISAPIKLEEIVAVECKLATDKVEIIPTFESVMNTWEREKRFTFSKNKKNVTFSVIFTNIIVDQPDPDPDPDPDPEPDPEPEPEDNPYSYTAYDDNIIKVDLANNRKQVILFVGTDIERSQTFIPKASNFDEVIRWGFGDVDFDVCRVAYDKNQELVEGVKNLAFYDDAIKTMQAIKAVKPDVEFWATLRSDYNGYSKKNNLPDWICSYPSSSTFDTKAYAIFLVDYLEHMEKNGVRVKYFSTSKEWTSHVTYSRAKKIIEYMIEELNKRSLQIPLFIDACAWSTDQGYFYVKNVVNSGFESYYYGFSCHNYSNSDAYGYERMVNKVNSITTKNSVGEQFYSFADETSGGTSASSGADFKSINSLLNSFRNRCELYADGMNGELIFELYSRGVDKETRSIYIPSTGDRTGYRISNYYAFKTHGNWLEDDMYYYSTTTQNMASNVYTMTFASDNRLYMCVINYNTTPLTDFVLDLKNKKLNGDVKLHVMDSYTVKTLGKMNGYMASGKLCEGLFGYDIPAQSLTFFLIDVK